MAYWWTKLKRETREKVEEMEKGFIKNRDRRRAN